MQRELKPRASKLDVVVNRVTEHQYWKQAKVFDN